MRKAKILATLGPASNTREVLTEMLQSGLNAVRINMSHGTQEEHAVTIKNAREAAAALDMPLSILVDLCGPKIRTRTLKDGLPIILQDGRPFTITTHDIVGDETRVATNFTGIRDVVEPGTRILIDDGAIELLVESEEDGNVNTRVITGGLLGERKGINLPNTSRRAGLTVSATPGVTSSTASISRRTSPISLRRFFGSLVKQRTSSRRMDGGVEAGNANQSGSRSRIFAIESETVSPANATRPVNIS